MENIIVKEIGDGMLRLQPSEGYRLYNSINKRYYSEATVRDPRPYSAVPL